MYFGRYAIDRREEREYLAAHEDSTDYRLLLWLWS